MFTALAIVDVSKIASDDVDGAGMATVLGRYELAIRSVEDGRDLVLGSFDVYMTRLAQRTNDVMKVVAIATVLLLPGSLIAGLLGMNVTVPLSKDDADELLARRRAHLDHGRDHRRWSCGRPAGSRCPGRVPRMRR